MHGTNRQMALILTIMEQAAPIMIGVDGSYDHRHWPLFDKALALYAEYKEKHKDWCDDYCAALAIGEAWSPGHPWNHKNAYRFVTEKKSKQAGWPACKRALF